MKLANFLQFVFGSLLLFLTMTACIRQELEPAKETQGLSEPNTEAEEEREQDRQRPLDVPPY